MEKAEAIAFVKIVADHMQKQTKLLTEIRDLLRDDEDWDDEDEDDEDDEDEFDTGFFEEFIDSAAQKVKQRFRGGR